MTDHSPTSSNSPAPQQQSAWLQRAEFSCPICKQVVVNIFGNELQYLANHTHVQTPSGHAAPSTTQAEYVSVKMYHPDEPEVGPGNILAPPEAFLIVQLLSITPNEK